MMPIEEWVKSSKLRIIDGSIHEFIKRKKRVDELNSISKFKAVKLCNKGYIDMLAVATAGMNEIAKAINISNEKALNVIREAQAELGLDFVPA